ncbi:MAG: hypothetical protein HLX50_13185 [Alteromonadaceae bacterium]|nr:hypothetical protein [Alteromonadaceae bacterium]
MDLRNNPNIMHQMVAPHGPNQRLALILYFAFKILAIAMSGLSIWLGYKLFVLGVSGEASLKVDAKGVSGQLLNAAPGLFFAVGGIIALIVIVWKGVAVKA